MLSMLRARMSNAGGLLRALGSMTRLAWQAYPVGFAGIIGIELLQGLIPVGTAWLTKLLFDLLANTLKTGAPTTLPTDLLWLLAAQAALSILAQLLMSLNRYLDGEAAKHITLSTRVLIYKRVNSLVGLAPFENPKIYDTIQLAEQGARYGTTQALRTLVNCMRSSVTIFALFGVLLSVNPLLAAGIGLSVLPQLFAQLHMGRQRFDLARHNSLKERRMQYFGHILAGAQFAKEVRLFGLADHFMGAFRGVWGEIHTSQRTQTRRELRLQSGLDLISNGVSALVFVAVVLQAFEGRLSLGDVTLYTSAFISVQAALISITRSFSSLGEGALFYSSFTDLLALTEPLALTDSVRPVQPLRAGIELRNVSFRYGEDGPWVLRNVHLYIPAGRCTAVVGLNGAGKTTLVKLLTRLYDPTEGEILWDGTDIRAFDPTDLRRHMSVVFQDFIRYELSVQQNVGLGDVNRMEGGEHVRRAATQAGVDEAIRKLPQDYDTILSRWLKEGSVGVDLSGGEWQKIAIARAFMRQGTADLLVLDEPTAALDAEAEQELYSRFVELMQGHTSLLISHRFSTIRMADLVVVLDNGAISEHGTHDELLLLSGSYAKLYNMQASQYR